MTSIHIVTLVFSRPHTVGGIVDASPRWCKCGKEHDVRLVTGEQSQQTHERKSSLLETSKGAGRFDVIVEGWFLLFRRSDLRW